MISNSERKLITSLQQKKYREKHRLFLIEGDKIMKDLLELGQLNEENTLSVYGVEEWIESNQEILEAVRSKVKTADIQEIKIISSLQSPPPVIAVVRMPANELSKEMLQEGYTIVLDSIRDPGNLGTIVRTADWFGIKNIVCSKDSVDVYNPKVVQATMGAVMRVNVVHEDLSDMLELVKRLKLPIYGATMDGEDFYDAVIKKPGVIVFGNEARGISSELHYFIKQKIRIPDFQEGKGSESLNLGISVAIVMSELRRRER